MPPQDHHRAAYQTLRYTFEELPLMIEDGFEAGLVNGYAEIAFWDEGEGPQWFVGDVYLDGARRKSRMRIFEETIRSTIDGSSLPRCYEEKPVEVEQNSPLYLMIFGRLDGEGRWRDAIAGDVRARLDMPAITSLQAAE